MHLTTNEPDGWVYHLWALGGDVIERWENGQRFISACDDGRLRVYEATVPRGKRYPWQVDNRRIGEASSVEEAKIVARRPEGVPPPAPRPPDALRRMHG